MRHPGCVVLLLTLIGHAVQAEGHGFGLSVNYNSNFVPTSISASSQEPFLDQHDFAAGPSNLFLGSFSSASSDSNGVYFPVIHGFAQTAGPWLPYTATYSVVSPLYFSNGTGSPLAVPAPSGTYIDMFDLWAGNPQPSTSPHPGAAFGDAYITGTGTSYVPSLSAPFGVSLFDTHEMEKDLYIGAGPTDGEYGFAYTVTAKFSDGTTLTTGPLVDVLAISDPGYGDFSDNAPIAQQDAATQAIYNAVTAVPEPSSLVLLMVGAFGLVFVCGHSRRSS